MNLQTANETLDEKYKRAITAFNDDPEASFLILLECANAGLSVMQSPLVQKGTMMLRWIGTKQRLKIRNCRKAAVIMLSAFWKIWMSKFFMIKKLRTNKQRGNYSATHALFCIIFLLQANIGPKDLYPRNSHAWDCLNWRFGRGF